MAANKEAKASQEQHVQGHDEHKITTILSQLHSESEHQHVRGGALTSDVGQRDHVVVEDNVDDDGSGDVAVAHKCPGMS